MIAPSNDATAALARQLQAVSDPQVLAAMLAVPRHVFVPPELQDSAYLDMPLPIGFGQTISQPLMVAHLLLAAKVQSTDRVLDVGCGSGYQAALLSLLAQQVIGLEIIPQLVQLAADNLQRAGCDGVRVVQGNGRHGYPECAPYDVIIVAAASQDVPPPLLAQLTVGGRLLIPIGADPQQVLQRWTRTETGYETSYLDACRFVPLVP